MILEKVYHMKRYHRLCDALPLVKCEYSVQFRGAWFLRIYLKTKLSCTDTPDLSAHSLYDNQSEQIIVNTYYSVY